MQSEDKQQQPPGSHEGTEPPFSSMQFMLILQLGIFIPLLGPVMVVLIGVLNGSSKEGRQLIWAGLGLLLLHVAMLTIIFALPAFREAKKEAAVRKYASELLEAFVVYTDEHPDDPFPSDLGMLYDFAKLGDLPINPYSGLTVETVDFDSENRPGNFTILPLYFAERPQGAKKHEFYLFFHGADDQSGEDFSGDGLPDNLIVILDSGWEKGNGGYFSPTPLDEVKHLLH